MFWLVCNLGSFELYFIDRWFELRLTDKLKLLSQFLFQVRHSLHLHSNPILFHFYLWPQFSNCVFRAFLKTIPECFSIQSNYSCIVWTGNNCVRILVSVDNAMLSEHISFVDFIKHDIFGLAFGFFREFCSKFFSCLYGYNNFASTLINYVNVVIYCIFLDYFLTITVFLFYE